MAVREKTLTRTVCSVKPLPTGSTPPHTPPRRPCGVRRSCRRFRGVYRPTEFNNRHPSNPPARHGSRVTLTNSLLQIPATPPQNPLQPVHQMLLLPKPMRLPRINNQLRLH